MREQPEWKAAVAASVPQTAPDFGAVYRRAGRRRQLAFTLAGTAAAAAALLVVLGLQAPAPPSFDNQVVAFVDLMYND